MSSYVIAEQKEDLVRVAQSVSEFSKNSFLGSKKVLKEELKTYLNSLQISGALKITVYDADLKVIYSHGKTNEKLNTKEVVLPQDFIKNPILIKIVMNMLIFLRGYAK